MYFPIIFGNHLVCLALPLLYLPEVVTAVLGFIHFGLFIGLLIVNIFIKDL